MILLTILLWLDRETETESMWESVCVCVRDCERESGIEWYRVREKKREWECMTVRVSKCVTERMGSDRESERERERGDGVTERDSVAQWENNRNWERERVLVIVVEWITKSQW